MSPTQGNVGQLRKLSNTSQPDIHHYRAHSADYADSDRGSNYSVSSASTKRDSETNTDQSHLLDASMRRMHRPNSAGSTGQNGGYGYRRPLSNTSTGSVGSNKSSGSAGSGKTSSSVGSRLAKHGVIMVDTGQKQGTDNGTGIPRPASATGIKASSSGHGGYLSASEAYSSATLERKKKGLNGAKPQDVVDGYKSNTLGRSSQQKFGSPNIGKLSQGENSNMCSSTIISNPHATYSKNDNGRLNGNSPQNSPNSNYVAMEYGSPRHSGSNQGIWLKHANGTHMSETESMESMSSHASSIHSQIQQARAHSGASARILAQGANVMGLTRSNSLKSTQSDSVYATTHHSMSEELTRTNSFSQLPSPTTPSSPTPSNSSHSSSRFTYPMTAYGGGSSGGYAMSQSMVRSNTQSSLPPYGMPLSKINRDEDGSRKWKPNTRNIKAIPN